MKAPFLVLFDCDGTLVDAQNGIIRAVQAAFQVEGLALPDAGDIRRGVGLSIEPAMARLLSEETVEAEPDLIDRLSVNFRDALLDLRMAADYHEPLYPGAEATIRALAKAGYTLGIATGKGRRGLALTLAHHGLADLFAHRQTADDAPSKPSPDMILNAIADSGVARERVAMIGDTSFDMAMAQAARVVGIGVSWGYHDHSALREAGAHEIVESFEEIPSLLRGLEARAPVLAAVGR